jgi:hypothetical protein
VLQNKKYIKFAGENSVEVLALGRLDEGIQKKDRRAGTYRAKDGNTYLLEWPNLTVEDIQKLRSSKASSYNNTGKIPYTAIVNPHTLEEMENILGGYSAGKLMEMVKAHKKELGKAYGKSLSRKTLTKARKQEKAIRADMEAGKLPQALAATSKLEKSAAKHAALVEMAGKIKADVLAACGKQLDELEAMIGRGATKDAKKGLNPLARALKGTPLEQRAAELLAQTKTE